MKYFILADFDAKMVKNADCEYSADANSGMRQIQHFFLHILVHLMTIRRSTHRTNLLGTPKGGPKVPPRGYAEKNFVFERGVQTTKNALICLDPLS